MKIEGRQMPDSAIGATVAHLRPIYSESDYDRMVALMNALLDVAGDDEEHPLSGLLERAADWCPVMNRRTTR